MFLLALLPIFAFWLLFLLLLARQPQQVHGPAPWQEPFIQTALFWSGFLALGTELLNLLRGLTTGGIVLLWVGALLGLGFFHWRFKSLQVGWLKFTRLFKQLRLGWFDQLALAVIVVALLILLITGLMSPPNIHDVLAYHMSRVMHWVQNQSLAFYPTTITWQLWMPPFSEFSQLHWQLLTGGDVLASSPQWYHLVFILVAVSATARLLGVSKRGQILSAMFFLTVPIVVLQASGAKNDIVLSFFIAALFYYVVKAATAKLTYLDWVAAGISVGLGVLTKGTFSFFALPMLAWLLVSMLKRVGWKKVIYFAALGLALVVLFNGWHWMRNTRTFGAPLTSEERSSLMNNRFGAKATLSNLSRHAVVQMNGKYGIINEAMIVAVERIHQWLKMPLFDPEITYGPQEFYYVPTREEVAGNPFHFAITGLLVLISVLGLLNKKYRNESRWVIIMIGVALGGTILFSTAFRWQAWGTRFFIPYYVLFSPVFGYYFGKRSPALGSWLLGITLVLALVNPLLNNYSRAFSWSQENRNSIWRLSRKGLLFANNQNIEGAVLELTHLMEQSQCRTYGVIMRSNAPEYLLWASLRPHANEYDLEHIQIDNITARHATSGFDPCGIILFESTEIDRVDDNKFTLVRRWQLGGEYPFSLFLSPAYLIEGLE